MSRDTETRLRDILIACEVITEYRQRADVDDDLLFDAIRIRLIEIGEAVKDLPPEVLKSEPSIPWREIVRMRDALAHRYFDASHAIVKSTAMNDVPLLAQATRRMLQNLERTKDTDDF